MNTASKIATASLIAGAAAFAYFGLVVHPVKRAANIAAGEACVEAKGVDCDDINMSTLKKGVPELHAKLTALGIE